MLPAEHICALSCRLGFNFLTNHFIPITKCEIMIPEPVGFSSFMFSPGLWEAVSIRSVWNPHCPAAAAAAATTQSCRFWGLMQLINCQLYSLFVSTFALKIGGRRCMKHAKEFTPTRKNNKCNFLQVIWEHWLDLNSSSVLLFFSCKSCVTSLNLWGLGLKHEHVTKAFKSIFLCLNNSSRAVCPSLPHSSAEWVAPVCPGCPMAERHRDGSPLLAPHMIDPRVDWSVMGHIGEKGAKQSVVREWGKHTLFVFPRHFLQAVNAPKTHNVWPGSLSLFITHPLSHTHIHTNFHTTSLITNL